MEKWLFGSKLVPPFISARLKMYLAESLVNTDIPVSFIFSKPNIIGMTDFEQDAEYFYFRTEHFKWSDKN